MSQPLAKWARYFGLALVLFVLSGQAFSQQASIASLAKFPTEPPPEMRAKSDKDRGDSASILASFIAAEQKVRDALNQHTFKRDVVLQTIGPNGDVTGEYIRNSQFLFDDRGQRIERVLFRPPSTIKEMRITKEDIQDLAGSQLLGIDIVEATKYRLSFVGPETIESRQLFAIDVTPLIEPNPRKMKERFFVGRVWVDPITFQIVKIKGIVEPQGKQRFPFFETWREPIKNEFAFPARTEADDVLHFHERDVHYRIKVRYYDYKVFAGKVSIKELDESPAASESQPKTEEKPSPKNSEAPIAKQSIQSKNETPAKATDVSPNQASRALKPPKTETCTTNRTAPPVGGYHWPADSVIKVYFMRGMFTVEQRGALLEAMGDWSTASAEIGSGVKFLDAGETDNRETCRGCLSIRRRDVYKEDRHHYAFFYPMNVEAGRLLVSAWIDLDFGIKSPKALKGFMVHELAHGLGLWDCTSCKKKLTIMNAFPGINKDNGLVIPSTCDLATVKGVYQEERQLAGLSTPTKQPTIAALNLALSLPPLRLTDGRYSLVNSQPPLGAAATNSPENTRSTTANGPTNTFGGRPLAPFGSSFSVPSLGWPRMNRFTLLQGAIFQSWTPLKQPE